jgi:hypothetical protein
LTTEERKELVRLRRENRQLRMEREILSKAAAWFARETGKHTCGRNWCWKHWIWPCGNAAPPRWFIIPIRDASASIAFGKRCKEADVRPSTGSVGDCFDNALCESFFATLECELLDRRRFKTQVEARMAVFEFIEAWYNPHRRHSGLDYFSPLEHEKHYTVNQWNLKSSTVHGNGVTPPVVFSVEEVKQILSCLNGRDLLVAGLLYGSGLRLMELAGLRVKDVDMDLNTLTVRGGKGDIFWPHPS